MLSEMTKAESYHLISISTCTLHNPPSICLTNASLFILPLHDWSVFTRLLYSGLINEINQLHSNRGKWSWSDQNWICITYSKSKAKNYKMSFKNFTLQLSKLLEAQNNNLAQQKLKKKKQNGTKQYMSLVILIAGW